ncbi:hypothetical protein SAMN05216540_103237 [Butyrivibrio sp. M55]|nr:hypothetical protein SAMN05216540_103237 [Butyrivibrio sp. M55]
MQLDRRETVLFVGRMVLLATLFLVIAGVGYIFVPYDQKLILFSDKYFKSFKELPYFYYIFWTFMFLQASVMIGVVSMFHCVHEELNTPLFVWISRLSTLGYLLMGLTYVSRLYYMPKVTREYLGGSDIVKEVVIAGGTMEFDKFLMSFGFASLWFFTLAIYSVRCKLFNVAIRVINFVCAFGYFIGLLGYFVQTRILTTGSSILVIIFPVWAIEMYKYCKKVA